MVLDSTGREHIYLNLEPSSSHLQQLHRVDCGTDVCAVMVTYNPDPSFEQNVRALLPQVGKLIIVDNQSTSPAHAAIVQVAAALKVEVIWNQQNLGIAGGLNVGIDRLIAAGGFSWIATFDQDSQVPRGYVRAMLEAYSACPFREEVAVIGCSYSNPVYERCGQWNAHQNDFEFREIKSAMTSGSFLNGPVLQNGERFDESLFMDYVDHEFCLRLRKKGFRIIQAGRAVLAHQLGAPTLHRLLGKPFLTSNHSATRRYFNSRNRMIVYRRYLGFDFAWVLADILGWVREMIKVVLVEPDRKQKFASVARGIWGARKAAKSGKPGGI